MRRVASACAVAALAALAGCAGPGPLRTAAAELALPAAIELDSTPFHPQTEHQCGPAALATLLGAAGIATTPAGLADEVYLPGRSGALQAELAAAVRARGLLAYAVSPALDALLVEIAAGRPVLVLQQLGFGTSGGWHYAVVIGYDTARGTVLLRSGTTRRLELRAAAFDYTWSRSGRWGLLALSPGELPVSTSAGRFMAAAAELEPAHPEAALLAYRAAAGRWPDSPLPWIGIGNVAARRGDWRAAERAFATALLHDASDGAALNNRAEALVRMDCTAAARLLLDDALARLPEDAAWRGRLRSARASLPDAAQGPDPPACDALAALP